MDSVGIDVHKRDSQICWIGEDGEVLERRIRTDRARFADVFGGRPRARILLESSTESEWVARWLEQLGHEVIVADPNFASMYATRSRRAKTDRRDARTLADACRLGAYRAAHRTSEARRRMRAQVAIRESLVRARARYISLVGALLGHHGWRVRTGVAETFLDRLSELVLPEDLQTELSPVLSVLATLNEQIRTSDKRLTESSRRDEVALRLTTVPSVGPVTACAFVAAIDDAKRFASAHQVEAYLGLVPSEMSSGEKQHKGRITKAGNTRVRWLLVQVALSTMRLRKPETKQLRDWAERIALRRGKLIAAVALARRIAGVMFALMRDGTCFNGHRLSHDNVVVSPS